VNFVNYVFVGTKLPKYALSAIKLAQISSGMEIHLIANHQIKSSVKSLNVRFTNIEDFYNPAEFNEVKRKIIYSNSFRDGFWHKTLERFFVIDQYLRYSGNNKFFHAELDQILFRTDKLVSAIEKTEFIGVFFPFHTSTHGCASIFYCNDPLTVRDFLEFTLKSEVLTSDMLLLADWSHEQSQKVFALPTIASEIKSTAFSQKLESVILKADQLDGIVDAAQLGQWIGGEDPRNIPLIRKPTNKYSEIEALDILSAAELGELRFELGRDQTLKIQFKDGSETNIYNLHLHSKIHYWLLKSKANLPKLIQFTNQAQFVTLPTTRKIQILYLLDTAFRSILKDPVGVIHRRLRAISNLFR